MSNKMNKRYNIEYNSDTPNLYHIFESVLDEAFPDFLKLLFQTMLITVNTRK